jgi:DnaJ-class molecular chaperone
MKNYYQILGLEKTASEQEIKQAYRKLAKTHHPDLGGDKEKFQELQEAFEILGDSVKRAQYDNPAPQFNRNTHQYHDFESNIDLDAIFASNPDAREAFRQFFGQERYQRKRVNRSIQLQVSITLEDAFFGKQLTAKLEMPSGNEQTVEFKIPAGISSGMTLNLPGIGDDTFAEVPRGDIHLAIHVQRHPIFERQGIDLIQKIEISSIDAMLGCTKVVTSIDNKELKTTIPAGIQNNAILSLPGYGMQDLHSQNRGRLMLEVRVMVEALTDKQKDELKKLKETWT